MYYLCSRVSFKMTIMQLLGLVQCSNAYIRSVSSTLVTSIFLNNCELFITWYEFFTICQIFDFYLLISLKFLI